jgi:hypothetical protein
MRGKRGISGLVITILLVLLALAAILIFWEFVKPIISGSGEQIQVRGACISLNLEPISCRYTEVVEVINATTNATVTSYSTVLRYKRGAGEIALEFAKVALILEKGDGSSRVIEATGEDVPAQLETRIKTVSLIEPPAKLSVSGILLTEAGDEAPCEESVKVSCNPQ